MRFYKIVSIIFHPILLPVFGCIYYFLINPLAIPKYLQYKITLIVAICTYLIPLILLFILKTFGEIKSYKLHSINQRKKILIFMTILFFILGNSFLKIREIPELAVLFIGASLALAITYFLFIYKIKTSIHMIGMGCITSFMILFGVEHKVNILLPTSLSFIMSGVIGQSRLHLKAHNSKEVYIGFFLGFFSQILISGLF